MYVRSECGEGEGIDCEDGDRDADRYVVSVVDPMRNIS